ncbi:MAG: hypothetical protein PHN64_06845 [Desulfovibrionaceae bacterium]|nr:hypothetical protein [Desulfovibrionaceae bacterium]
MHEHITIIPSDKLILLDGMGLHCRFAAPATLHALQWHEGAGHLEFTDGKPNQPLTGEADFARHVQPFVTVWQAEKARLDAEAAQAESEAEAARAAAEAAYNSLDATRARKLAEIAAAYESVLAYVIAPEGKDNLAAALAVADFTAEDPEGLAFIRAKLAARKAELEAQTRAAGSVDAVQAVEVRFAV